MDTDQSADIRRRDLPRPIQECLQLSRYLQRQRRKWEDNIKTALKELGFVDWRLKELIHDSVLLRTWILTVLPFGFQVVYMKKFRNVH
jgi:enamine deaminase RidA (YjgF/YER057c/UK114 family)